MTGLELISNVMEDIRQVQKRRLKLLLLNAIRRLNTANDEVTSAKEQLKELKDMNSDDIDINRIEVYKEEIGKY